MVIRRLHFSTGRLNQQNRPSYVAGRGLLSEVSLLKSGEISQSGLWILASTLLSRPIFDAVSVTAVLAS